MHKTFALSLVAAALLAATPARSDDGWGSRDYDFARRQLDDFINRFETDLVHPTYRAMRAKRAAAAAATSPGTRDAITSVAARSPLAPREFAASYPAAQRAEAEKSFGELLELFHRVEKAFGLPEYDVAVAMAGFVAASYGAYRGQPIPDEHFKPLVAQMRGVLADQPGFAKVAVANKQAMYEQLAILGMLLSATQMALKDRHDAQMAERLRGAGKVYLEQFLKTDAEKVRISGKGLDVGG